MRKNNLLYSLLLLSGLFLVGCAKTSNTINNGSVISAPYSLHFVDTAGTLYNSNDGQNYKVIVAADGQPARSIIAMGDRLLVAKYALYMTKNNGVNFNTSYDGIVLDSVQRVNINGRIFDLNQSMAIYPDGWSDHAYIATRDLSASNYFGIAWNTSGGDYGTWVLENRYDSPQVAHFFIRTSSFTRLANGTLVAYDANNRMGVYRTDLNAKWREMFTSSLSTPLALPAGPGNQAFFSLGHINNRIIAIDNYGSEGAYYSDDLGTNWTSYPGLPANTPLTCTATPFEQTCLIGTDSAGLYKLNLNTDVFEQVTNGLPANLIVRSITAKQNVYKNDTRRQYIYLATNQGIYQSVDMGVNWTRTIPGNFTAIY